MAIFFNKLTIFNSKSSKLITNFDFDLRNVLLSLFIQRKFFDELKSNMVSDIPDRYQGFFSIYIKYDEIAEI